jgi:hypothetical protein
MDGIQPIADRVGHVGGVESITVDGRRWYFGFDYSLDTVVSPLIDDPAAMSAFASRYMLQHDGEHDEAYWQELVDFSVDDSELVLEDADRVFTSAQLAADRLTPGYHLQYLLGAAMGWDHPFLEEAAIEAALTTVGVGRMDRDWDCIDVCIAALTSPDADKARAAQLVMARYVDAMLDAAPANWADVFGGLRAP